MAYILLLDDDAEFHDIVVQALRVDGHSVLGLTDGSRVEQTLRATPIDLVITDVVMPGRDGIEIIMSLRKSHPQLPIIAMSGDPNRTSLYLKIAENLGAVRTLRKPFNLQDLRNVIREIETGARGGG